jgi:hypothetical protein
VQISDYFEKTDVTEKARISMMIKTYKYVIESNKTIDEVLEEVRSTTKKIDSELLELLLVESEIQNYKQYEAYVLEQ